MSYNSVTIHTILKDRKYFSQIKMDKAYVTKISSSTRLIESFGRAIVVLLEGTRFIINNALFSSKSQRNLLSFKDICCNGYHTKTMCEGNNEYLYITNIVSGKKSILEKLLAFSFGLYYTRIKTIEIHTTI